MGPRLIQMGEHHRGGPGGLIALVLFALLVAAVVSLWIKVSRLSRPAFTPSGAAATAATSAPAGDGAINLLRTRYASGEVTRDDYVRMAADLGAPVSVPTAPPTAPLVAPPG